eukprot:8225160-Heterocapsa_arctica.AAC.1
MSADYDLLLKDAAVIKSGEEQASSTKRRDPILAFLLSAAKAPSLVLHVVDGLPSSSCSFAGQCCQRSVRAQTSSIDDLSTAGVHGSIPRPDAVPCCWVLMWRVPGFTVCQVILGGVLDAPRAAAILDELWLFVPSYRHHYSIMPLYGFTVATSSLETPQDGLVVQLRVASVLYHHSLAASTTRNRWASVVVLLLCGAE